jgi:DNA-binding CsgD family transcriptional regulator
MQERVAPRGYLCANRKEGEKAHLIVVWQAIIGLLPRDGVLLVLAMGLEATKMWEQRDGGLWLREEYLPPFVQSGPHLPSPQKPSMTPAQQEQAILLIRQGMSLREVAKLFDTSYQSVFRLVKKAKRLVEGSE